LPVENNAGIMILMLALLIFFLIVLQPFQVFAAGRIQLETSAISAPAGTTVGVKIKLLQGDATDAQPSTGEKAELKIEKAQPGQECKTDTAPSDSSGIVLAACTSDKPGNLIVYAVSKDRGDSSEQLMVKFTEKTDASPTGSQTSKQSTRQQNKNDPASELTNQEGLAEDRNNGQGQPMIEGLQTANTSGTQPTQAPIQEPHTSDIDLLNSLIYLTGGIILLIAGIYFIYVQSKQANIKKKDIEQPPVEPGKPEPVTKTS
jgi:hypothetical protein